MEDSENSSTEIPEDTETNYNEIKKSYSEIITLLSQIKNSVTKQQKGVLVNYEKLRGLEQH
jgi:hypothetical protein